MVEIKKALDSLKSGDGPLDLVKIKLVDICQILYNTRKEFVNHTGFRYGSVSLKEPGLLHGMVKDRTTVFVSGGVKLTLVNPKETDDQTPVYMSAQDVAHFADFRKPVFQLNGTEAYVEVLMTGVVYNSLHDVSKEPTQTKLVTYHILNNAMDEGLFAVPEDSFFSNFTAANYEGIDKFRKYVDKLVSQRESQQKQLT